VCVRSGRILAYLEIKFRRVEFSEFGDAMFPERKVRFAREVCHDRGEYPLIAVTEYACGTLVEVDLRDEPAERRFVKRFDRTKAVPHVFYSKDQLTVLDGPRPTKPPKPKPAPKPKTPRSPSRRRVHVA
jgi:hypothetical protein